jgi:hypothetical protein
LWLTYVQCVSSCSTQHFGDEGIDSQLHPALKAKGSLEPKIDLSMQYRTASTQGNIIRLKLQGSSSQGSRTGLH